MLTCRSRAFCFMLQRRYLRYHLGLAHIAFEHLVVCTVLVVPSGHCAQKQPSMPRFLRSLWSGGNRQT